MNNIKKLTCWWTLKKNRARDIILTENCEKRQIHSPINPRETHHVNCISVATEAIGVQILGKSISISESNEEEEEEESRHWRSLTQPFPSKSFRQRIIDTREGKRVSSIPGQYLDPSSSSCNPRLTDYFPFRSLKHFCFAFISDSLSHSIMYSSQPDRVPRLQWSRTNGKTDPRVWIGRCARARMGLAKDPRADNLFEENEREIREIHFERMVSLFFFFF